MGGVVPMAVGGVGIRAFTASCLFALFFFCARASEMAGASDRAAGCSCRVNALVVLVRRHCCAVVLFLLCCLLHWPQVWQALRIGLLVAWGMPWGRGARVEVRRLWGVRGVVPVAVEHGSSRLYRIMFFALLLFLQGHQVWQGLRIGLLGALGERHGAGMRVLR